MIHKTFEVIEERVVIEDILDKSQLDVYIKALEGNSDYLISNENEIRKIVESGKRHLIGIFQESEIYATIAEGNPRPALDFIVPIYNLNLYQEELAKGINPRERINPENPILSIYMGVDHLLLNYTKKINDAHLFVGKLSYEQGVFYNDGNFEIYDKYRNPLKKAGFKIT